MSGNSKLKEIYTELCCRMRLFRLQAHALEGALSPEAINLLETGIARRACVIEALATRDPTAAANAVSEVALSALARNHDFYLRALGKKKMPGGGKQAA